MKTLKIFSWNVNGIRAVLNKGALQKFIDDYDPDILCLQETKAKQGQAEVDLPEYEEIWNSAERPGYSGTAVFTKLKPLSIKNTIETNADFADAFGDPLKEGRVQTLEFEDFYLVNIYTPNSKRSLERLQLREKLWDPAIVEYLKSLKDKPVVVCGDFNAAHTEIDLARPKDNVKNAGFTIEERRGVDNLLNDAKLLDTFREKHPGERRYTWWSHWGHARENNVGWRIDYFFISKSLEKNLKIAEIYEHVTGSDHCPIGIELEF